ncbi:MAG TPA: DUF4215 domain-containing protein, partial [Polyangium sp.]|nr:DUF4215 domain-containing protein [Polyangium sp.]
LGTLESWSLALCVNPNSYCGNGTVEAVEPCDDGNSMSGDGCSKNCTVEPGYMCTTPMTGPSVCTGPMCGNGMIEAGEQCDDNNSMSGDGCSATCFVEPNFQCTGQAPTMCIPFETTCGDNLDNDGDTFIDNADDDCIVQTYFPPCAMGQTRRVYRSTNMPAPIPYDPNFLIQTINVTGAGTIARAALVYDITHPYVEDINLFLTLPDNSVLDMCTFNGGAGDNYRNTVLDSTCSPSIVSVTETDAPFSACYAPESSLAMLTGMSGDGTWKLVVTDTYDLTDDGTLNRWALILCTTP